jgi:hypothetical protein
LPPQQPIDEFGFAVRRAIKDHRKNELSEQALSEFEDDLIAWRSSKSDALPPKPAADLTA